MKAIQPSSPTVELSRETTPTNRPVIPPCESGPQKYHSTNQKGKPPKRSQADKRIDFLLKKHFDDDPDFRPLILELAELDPTPKKKYLAWLVKHWTGPWNPSDDELKRVAQCLEIHHKGAKYFSPLSWLGLRLEDAGYHADIFKYTPETIARVSGKIAEIIRIDEEDKQIRKGNPVALAGAELVHRDEQFTIIRIRSREALKRFGQNTSWCVQHGNPMGYRFPFDFILDEDGNRYLANRNEIRDRWDRCPEYSVRRQIADARERIVDPCEIEAKKKAAEDLRFRKSIKQAIEDGRSLTEDEERKILQDADLAINYAARVIGGPWRRFESQTRVADLTATQAVDYAVQVRKKRWRKFENKIKRSVGPLAEYRKAFPGSIPKTDKEIFKEQLQEWRSKMPKAYYRPLRRSAQGRAECLERDFRYEASLAKRRYSMDRYCRFLASLATSSMADRYHEKVSSFFIDAEGEEEQTTNLPIARELCRRFDRPMRKLEEQIAKDAVCSLNYAEAMGERFLDGEAAILADPKLAPKYRRRFLQREPEPKFKRQGSRRGYLTMPTNFKVAWR